MALTINKLKMWKDPGYTRGCLEVPPMGSKKLPATPDYALAASDTLRPHKGSTLTELHLPLSFTQVFGMSYLYIEATDGAGTVKLFGWIISVDQRSTSAEGVTIRWDVDWWRSFSGDATYTHLHVTKTNDSSYSRPLNMRPRRWVYKEKLNFIQHLAGSYPTDTLTYSVLVFTYLDGSGNLTYGLSCTQFKVNGYASTFSGIGTGSADQLATYLNVPASNIKGCWVVPIIDPNCFMASGVLVFPNSYYSTMVTSGGKSFFISTAPMTYFWSMTISTTEQWRTTDNERTQFTDAAGTPYWTVPYDFEIKSIAIKTDIGATQAYSMIIFSEDATPPTDVTFDDDLITAIAEGRYCMVPMEAAPVTSSALSDYYASGQRDYDIEARKIDQERNAWSGFLGIGGSIAGGTVAGSLTGNPIGAAAGAVSGAVSGIGGTIANYWLTENYNDRLQRATEQLYSNQAGQLITIGGTKHRLDLAKKGFYFVKTIADTVSYDNVDDMIAASGYDVDIYEGSSSTFLTSGCTTQLADVTITGSIPPEAKQYIKLKLQAGVIIVENNPSGVAP